MNKLMIVGAAALLAGCAATPPAPPKVVWLYGTGNGDPTVATPAPKPAFARLYGAGNGDPVVNPNIPMVNKRYSYGGDGMTSQMVEFAPTPAK